MNKFLLCVSTFLLFTTPVQAKNSYPRIAFSDFGTFGYTGTDSQQLGYLRDLSQSTEIKDSWSPTLDSRLGLQGDIDFSETLHATMQWIAREAEVIKTITENKGAIGYVGIQKADKKQVKVVLILP